jgi:hypothetical protein
MSTQSPPRHADAPGSSMQYGDRALGWSIFGGSLLLIIGVMNLVTGIAAIGNSQFFVDDARFVFGNLDTWGWIVTILGVGALAAGVGVFANSRPAAWLGAGFAALNAVAMLLFLPAYPFLALALFAVDIAVIHGLIKYGGRETA